MTKTRDKSDVKRIWMMAGVATMRQLKDKEGIHLQKSCGNRSRIAAVQIAPKCKEYELVEGSR